MWKLGLCLALAAGGLWYVSRNQEPASQVVRIYYLERATPPRDLEQARASLTIEPEKGEGATVLLPLVRNEAHAHTDRDEGGMIRGLPGTPYFVEFCRLKPNPPSGSQEPRSSDEERPATVDPSSRKLLTSRQVLSRAHRGPYFESKLPTKLLTEPFKATVTFRFEDQTLTSEEFESPASSAKDAVSNALATVKALAKRSLSGADFMELKPMAQEFMRHLHQLAPAGFKDDTGVLEQDRQWCLAMGRDIEDACDQDNPALVRKLSLECEPRLERIQSAVQTRVPHQNSDTPSTSP